MPNLETYKREDAIPDAEKADMSVSPVTAEEMVAAMAALNETGKEPAAEQKAKDEQAIENLRQTLSGVPETPGPIHDGGGGDDELEPIILHEGSVSYSPCEICHGTGRKWFILNCPGCGGKGSIPEGKMEWSEKVVGLRPKSENPDHLNI